MNQAKTGFLAASGFSELGTPFRVNVTNTGQVDSDEVVLGFLKPPGAGRNGVPLQSLFGFERAHVRVGQTVTVSLYPTLLDFTAVNPSGQRVPLPGHYTVQFGVPGAPAALAQHALAATESAPPSIKGN